MSFSGKVVLVTGAASGIGEATALLFAKEGANVGMVDRNADRLKTATDRGGSNTFAINADLSKKNDLKAIVDSTIDKYGRIDVLVNCAGIFDVGGLLDGSVMDTFEAILNINLRAAVFLTSLVSPHIVKSKGSIINVSSTNAVSVFPDSPASAYGITKAGIEIFTKCAALELAEHGVRVNAVRPGPVRTNISEALGLDMSEFSKLTLLDRVSEPDELGSFILYLASEKAKGITGSIFTHDNGLLLKQS